MIGGGMSYTFSAAVGGKIGDSLLEADKEDLAKEFMEKGAGKLFLIHIFHKFFSSFCFKLLR